MTFFSLSRFFIVFLPPHIQEETPRCLAQNNTPLGDFSFSFPSLINVFISRSFSLFIFLTRLSAYNPIKKCHPIFWDSIKVCERTHNKVTNLLADWPILNQNHIPFVCVCVWRAQNGEKPFGEMFWCLLRTF